jgi:hypothetical protein
MKLALFNTRSQIKAFTVRRKKGTFGFIGKLTSPLQLHFPFLEMTAHYNFPVSN